MPEREKHAGTLPRRPRWAQATRTTFNNLLAGILMVFTGFLLYIIWVWSQVAPARGTLAPITDARRIEELTHLRIRDFGRVVEGYHLRQWNGFLVCTIELTQESYPGFLRQERLLRDAGAERVSVDHGVYWDELGRSNRNFHLLRTYPRTRWGEGMRLEGHEGGSSLLILLDLENPKIPRAFISLID